MQIKVRLPDGVFATPKSEEQVAIELRQAAAMYWLARGEISPEQALEITASKGELPQAEPRAGDGLIELLLAMPDVGDDADFARPADYGRSEEPWDT